MNLPIDFQNRMKNYLGQEYDAFLASFNEPSVKAFHVNTSRVDVTAFNNSINELLDSSFNSFTNIEPISNNNQAYYYNADKIGNTACNHAGIIYSQDPCAMLPVSNIPFDIKGNEKVLDLCAAPGGKSSQLAMLVPNGALLCNEINPSRNKILISNIERMGYTNVLITKSSPDQLENHYNSYFDIILVDAPCSGEGMFRKYPESMDEWSLDNVNLCSDRQKTILDSAIAMLAPGGHLIYSTCTYSKEEDEDIVDYILTKNLDIVPVQDKPYIKCYPHIFKGEGQFLAYFVKKGSKVSSTDKPSKLKTINSKTKDIIHEALKDSVDIASLNLYEYNDLIISIPDNYIRMPLHGITYCGIPIGSVEKNRFVPKHGLFHSFGTLFKSRLDFSTECENLYKYLHGEEIVADVPNGYGVISYMGASIGGYKASNGRLKNHYPKGLRNL